MSEIISSVSSLPTARCRDAASPIAPLPTPATPMSVRVATREDVPFMDQLQKAHSKALGFFPRAQMEAYIDAGNVFVAEVAGSFQPSACSESDTASCKPEAVGYCISRDRYLKRDELGAVFQLCVAPGKQRSFIGANLLREVFERSAYGCKLFCCWCAQDLAANKFWEAMGFVPIAFRAGGNARGSQPAVRSEDSQLKAASCKLKASPRVHIFWQKRIRAGDNTTPYWFPAKTEGGAIREDRVILPIPPGMRWTDELPVLVGEEVGDQESEIGEQREEAKRLPGKSISRRKAESIPHEAMSKVRTLGSVLRFRPVEAATVVAKPMRESRPANRINTSNNSGKPKASPELIAKARELRDRWMDHVAANPGESIAPLSHGKYEIGRTLAPVSAMKRLAA